MPVPANRIKVSESQHVRRGEVSVELDPTTPHTNSPSPPAGEGRGEGEAVRGLNLTEHTQYEAVLNTLHQDHQKISEREARHWVCARRPRRHRENRDV